MKLIIAIASSFVIYQGHHGDAGAHNADIVLPGAAYTEKDGIYLNTEGRVQYANRAAFRRVRRVKTGPSFVRFQVLLATIGMDSLAEVRDALCEAVPHFAMPDQVVAVKWAKFGGRAKLSSQPVTNAIKNFYMTCAISRASETMAECRRAQQADATGAVAAE